MTLLTTMIFASAPAAMACENNPCNCSCDCNMTMPCERGAVRGIGSCYGMISAVATEFSNDKLMSRGFFAGMAGESKLMGVLVVDEVDAEDGELSGMAHIFGYSDPVAFTITTIENCGKGKITLSLDLPIPVKMVYYGSVNFKILHDC
ncbi:MAG: hypothetical protein SVJ22_01780 [Halobacteriota archaeon]|nr:hypothetical protein [Halobacteriota archaeon]